MSILHIQTPLMLPAYAGFSQSATYLVVAVLALIAFVSVIVALRNYLMDSIYRRRSSSPPRQRRRDRTTSFSLQSLEAEELLKRWGSAIPENHWAAFDKDELVATAPTVEELLLKLDEKNKTIQDVTIAFKRAELSRVVCPPLNPPNALKLPHSVSISNPGSKWLERHYDKLPRSHWVAANGKGLVAVEKDVDSVYAKLRELDVKLEEVCIMFVDEPAPPLRRQ